MTHDFDLSGSRDVIGHVSDVTKLTIQYRVCHFLPVHCNRVSPEPFWVPTMSWVGVAGGRDTCGTVATVGTWAPIQRRRWFVQITLLCLHAFLFLTLPDLSVAHQNAAFLQCLPWGPLETRHGNREFSGISYGGGGEFFDFWTGIPGGLDCYRCNSDPISLLTSYLLHVHSIFFIVIVVLVVRFLSAI